MIFPKKKKNGSSVILFYYFVIKFQLIITKLKTRSNR